MINTEILFEDKFIVVCIKDAGVLSEIGGMPELLRKATGATEIFCVHRLDKAVGGVMVYAKTSRAAAKLSAAMSSGEFQKEYLAVVQGVPEKSEGCMRDLLFHDSKRNKTYVVERERKGVKEAILDYRTEASASGVSLVRIRLHTGRSHQIRVQFASRKMPLLGDGKYGSRVKDCALGLFACSLSFPHPLTGKNMSFSARPAGIPPWNKFDI